MGALRAKPCAVALLAALAACGRVGYEVVTTAEDGPAPGHDAAADVAEPTDHRVTPDDIGGMDRADPTPDAAVVPDVRDALAVSDVLDAAAVPPDVQDAFVAPDVSPPRDMMEAPPRDSDPDSPAIRAVVAMGQTATPRRGGSGTSVTDVCRDGGMLIGFSGTHSPNASAPAIQSLSGVCATFMVTASGAPSVWVTTVLSTRGNTGGTPWTRNCPAGHVLTGFDGNARSAIGQLVFRCAPLTLAPSGTTVMLGSAIELDDVGGPPLDDFPETDCPAGQAARGAEIRAGTVLEAFGLVCGTPTVVTR